MKNWSLFWYQINQKLGRLGGHLLFAVCVAVSAWAACRLGAARSREEGIFFVVMCAVSGLFTGLLFIRIYLPGIAENMAFGFFFPRRYLKKVPLILSPIHGLISNGRYDEAEMRLLELQSQYPGNAEVVAMLVDLYADKKPSPEALVAVAECYFLQNVPRRDAHHMFVLMRYADCVMAFGAPENMSRLAAFLKRELRKRRLTPPEQKAVLERLNTLEKQLQTKGGGYA